MGKEWNYLNPLGGSLDEHMRSSTHDDWQSRMQRRSWSFLLLDRAHPQVYRALRDDGFVDQEIRDWVPRGIPLSMFISRNVSEAVWDYYKNGRAFSMAIQFTRGGKVHTFHLDTIALRPCGPEENTAMETRMKWAVSRFEQEQRLSQPQSHLYIDGLNSGTTTTIGNSSLVAHQSTPESKKKWKTTLHPEEEVELSQNLFKRKQLTIKP